MSITLLFAIITITLALIFYTIGVWSEHKSKELKVFHVVFFWLGLCMDTTGTTLMSRIADNSAVSGKLLLHGITGFLAIGLMFIHAIWATIVMCKKNEEKMQNFHKFSLFVWLVWLVPYVIGMVMGMM